MKISKLTGVVCVLFVILVMIVGWLSLGSGKYVPTGRLQLGAASVALSSANNFAVLAGSGITVAGAVNSTTITGDIGTYAITTITGIGNVVLNGTNHAGDAITQGAKTALTTSYTDAANQTPAITIASDLGTFLGGTLTPGVYNSASSIGLTGTLTLDGGGDPNAVFVFQAGSTLTTASASSVVLTNGAQACNVFWQVGSSATLGTNSTFVGSILALTDATLTTGANVTGRVLARNGAVTLDTNIINVPSCASAGSGGHSSTLISGQSTINVVKMVINDNGGTKSIADFPLFIGNLLIVSGATNNFTVTGNTSYTVSETKDSHYAGLFSGDCDASGRVSINPGENKFCIITNDDIGPPSAVLPVPPLIDVVKVPSPLALPNGAGPVLYTYTLRNIGVIPVTNITMVGDSCSPIHLVSGDTNADSKLDLNETWVYSCSTTLSKTHTNTVVATGWANGLSATDIASATVVVGVPVVPPLIHVTKVPNPLALSAIGGLVTYTEKITNPGNVVLSNVSLIDDKCTPMKYISGDTNADSKLDTTETWTYTCRANLTKTTTNTAIVTGIGNGIMVRDMAIATVVVSAPGLPNAGLPPQGLSVLLVILMSIGIVFYFNRKKHRA